ncbi:MAG: helix-turn-helix domain-containing protein [Acidobacteriota bacterium]
MQIKSWLKSRDTPGTLADVARRVLEGNAKYREVEKTLQSMYVLEALLKHKGHQQRTADAIGVTRETVKRTMRAMGVKASDIRALTKFIEGRQQDGDRAPTSTPR